MSDVLIAGDFYVALGHRPAVDDAVRTLITASRHALINMEAPATDSPERIGKSGPHLTMPPSSLDLVTGLGFDVVTLANNHILDAGLSGLRDTLESASERGLLTVGASLDPGGARSAARLRLPLAEGLLTVLNYCEHEWSVREDGSGAAHWDIVDAFTDVQAARASGDRVLVVLHGGNEYFPLPRPQLRKQLRFLAEHGADAIVMHHSHVPAAYEVWHDVPIFYGLGNFQFTLPSPNGYWYEGLLVALSFPPDGAAEFEIVPARQSPEFDVSLAGPEQAAETLNQLEGYRIQVASDPALEARWREFAQGARGGLLRALAPSSAVRPAVGRRAAGLAYASALQRDLITRRTMVDLLQCESLHEVLTTALRDTLPADSPHESARVRDREDQ